MQSPFVSECPFVQSRLFQFEFLFKFNFILREPFFLILNVATLMVSLGSYGLIVIRWHLQAVLEKQSYMLIGRSDVENWMRLDPANACLQESSLFENNFSESEAEAAEAETQLIELLLSLRPIKQVFF